VFLEDDLAAQAVRRLPVAEMPVRWARSLPSQALERIRPPARITTSHVLSLRKGEFIPQVLQLMLANLSIS
jgi:hypothetical protein